MISWRCAASVRDVHTKEVVYVAYNVTDRNRMDSMWVAVLLDVIHSKTQNSKFFFYKMH